VSEDPLITFLSDYGLADPFAGICHGVIASICPRARVIDLTHAIPRHDARAGAMVLREALGYVPVGVHLAVVDPGVGAERRAVALRLRDARLLVGPDNGLLSLAAEQGGGVVEAVEIGRSPFRLKPVSATFHGRDIFAPVAAHLAAGMPLGEAGEPYDADALIKVELPRAHVEQGVLVAHAVYVDAFGNVQLDASHEDLAELGLELGGGVLLGGGHEAHYARTFADASPGELIVYEDSARTLAVAVSHGSAAERLGLGVDAELRISARR